MPQSTPQTIPFPREGYVGLAALIELGPDGLKKLSAFQASEPLSLDFSNLYERLADALGCDSRTVQAAVMSALVPLNGLRRRHEIAPASEFLNVLDRTVTERGPDSWKKEHYEDWQRILRELEPFFEPDSFFSQASKAFDLLAERPAILHNVRILTEIRPLYDEATTKTLALLQSNTLVLNYWDGDSIHTIHLTLDSADLDALHNEVNRAKKKLSVSQKEAQASGAHLLTFGESEESNSTKLK